GSSWLGDLRHAHRRDRLTVAATPPVVLPALLLVDEDLSAATLCDDLAAHDDAGNERCADAHGVGAGGEQHFGELDRGTRVTGEALDVHHVAGCDAILLSSGADDGVSHGDHDATGLPRGRPVCT